MQSQLVCNGCRNVLLYPRGAASVRCAVCNIITSAPPLAADMAQLVCAGCRTLLMHANGAVSVQCSRCQTTNGARPENQVAHVNCGGCHSTLMYAYGAPSVRCAICQYVTNIGPISMRMPNGSAATLPSSSTQTPAKSHTVVVENPMSVDGSGKLVSNVAVGVTTERKKCPAGEVIMDASCLPVESTWLLKQNNLVYFVI